MLNFYELDTYRLGQYYTEEVVLSLEFKKVYFEASFVEVVKSYWPLRICLARAAFIIFFFVRMVIGGASEASEATLSSCPLRFAVYRITLMFGGTYIWRLLP